MNLTDCVLQNFDEFERGKISPVDFMRNIRDWLFESPSYEYDREGLGRVYIQDTDERKFEFKQRYLNGSHLGLGDARSSLERLASLAFLAGQDSEAKALREAIGHIEELGRRVSANHKANAEEWAAKCK